MGAVVGLVLAIGILLVLSTRGSSGPRAVERTDRLVELMRQAGVRHATRGNLVAACVASAVVVGVLVLIVTAVPIVAVMAAFGAAVLPVVLLRRRLRSRRLALRSAWPDAVDNLASAIRAGLSLPDALAALGERGPEPLRPAFSDFAADYRASGAFGSSLDRLQADLADPVADRVLGALRIAREVGGADLGLVLRTVSTLLREDARTRGEIESRQSWTVSAARLAVAAPWVTLAFLCTRPEAVAAYSTFTGALVLLAAAGISFVAYRAMVRIGRLPGDRRVVRA